MKKNSKIKFVFAFIFLSLLSLTLFLLLQIMQIKENESENLNIEVIGKTEVQEDSIEGILNKHDAIYIGKKGTRIMVEFPKNLYDENGNSNKDYFENLILDLCDLEELKQKNFSLDDGIKKIKITVIYDEETESYKVIYNEIENFYSVVDGEDYVGVETAEIIEKGYTSIASHELNQLIRGNMFFKYVSNVVDEGTPLNDTYTSFRNGAILMRILNSKVRNIVFTEEYTSDILYGIKVGDDLSTIMEKYPNISGGSIDRGYIYYRTEDVYIFFYDDEVSAYGYSYFENVAFESFLETYLIDKNLDQFIQNVTQKWTNYEKYEYNPDIQTAHITFPSRGVEINIKDNNPIGITLYNNYYLTDKTKEFIKEGKINLNANEDLLLLSEINRRESY